jgi:hypothetical protein
VIYIHRSNLKKIDNSMLFQLNYQNKHVQLKRVELLYWCFT